MDEGFSDDEAARITKAVEAIAAHLAGIDKSLGRMAALLERTGAGASSNVGEVPGAAPRGQGLMSAEAWRAIHEALDTAMAAYMLEHRDKRPSTTSVIELAEWTNKKATAPDPLLVNCTCTYGPKFRTPDPACPVVGHSAP